ncbi:hypothetical protein FQR65_LT12570 [Abscondita terminalis]|nr:hypothetical protein FQR65_LT12570 [Abscondita terminalis]
MPLLSVDEKSDALILRALQIAGFDAKGLPVDGVVALKVGGEEEVFKRAVLRPNSLSTAVHRDLFCGLARTFACSKAVVEAHDEFSYVNEEVVLGTEPLTAIIAAVKTPGVDVSTIYNLIQLGAGVNTAVIGGHVPLYYAVLINRPDVLELLLRNGADPDHVDKYGNRPLFYACMEGKARLVELLLKYKADRYSADYYGVTPVFMAYRAKNYEILKILMKGNENPIAADVAGCNILHRAASDGDLNCLRCAVETTPDMNVFMVGDVKGRTPLEVANDHGNLDFANILQKFLPKNS